MYSYMHIPALAPPGAKLRCSSGHSSAEKSRIGGKSLPGRADAMDISSVSRRDVVHVHRPGLLTSKESAATLLHCCILCTSRAHNSLCQPGHPSKLWGVLGKVWFQAYAEAQE